MKKLLLIMLVCVGCTQDKRVPSESIDNNYSIVKVRDCEYVQYYDHFYNIPSITHAGDCSNPIHLTPKQH